jgi:hypothetical protein
MTTSETKDTWSEYYRCLEHLQVRHGRVEIENCRLLMKRVLETLDLPEDEVFL